MISQFNLNVSRKNDYKLNESLIHENIQIYGVPCSYLFSARVNEDKTFNDFSHFKVDPNIDYLDIMLLPEDASNWGGENVFNSFGFYNQQNTNVFISKSTMLEIYPDFLTSTDGRTKIINSLLIIPSGTILEITDLNSYSEGISNLWNFSDDPSSYKLSTKVYDINLADENIENIKTTIKLKEAPDGEIFEYDEEIDTSELDNFFDQVEKVKVTQDELAEGLSNTNNPFGSLD